MSDRQIPEEIRTAIQLLDKAFFQMRSLLEVLSSKKDVDGLKFRLKEEHSGHPLWQEEIVPAFKAFSEQLTKLQTTLSIFYKQLESLKEVQGYAKLMNHM